MSISENNKAKTAETPEDRISEMQHILEIDAGLLQSS
jgi:hypothetical protein